MGTRYTLVWNVIREWIQDHREVVVTAAFVAAIALATAVVVVVGDVGLVDGATPIDTLEIGNVSTTEDGSGNTGP